MLYTTLSSLKTKLGITNTDSDSELSLVIEKATNLIDFEIGFNLEKQILSKRIDGTGTNKIYLDYKANLINKIQSKDGFIYYNLDFIDGYIIYTEEKIPKGIKNILIEFEIGFDEIPKDIENICLDLSVILSNQVGIIGTNTDKLIDKNIKTQKLGSLSITYFGENEKKQNSFDKLNPANNISKIINKYKSFTGII